MDPIRLFVGYDRDQVLASQVFAHSACRYASMPVQVQFLALSQLREIFNRPRDPYQSTDFAFTRFLVPYLCGYRGWALFCDGDMICRADLAELWALRDDRYAVQVVQRRHHEMPPDGRKFLGRVQTAYPRKNWSSVMLFNNALCGHLTPQIVDVMSGLDLHQFAWAHDEALGALPPAWNHLVGVDVHDPEAKIAHFTLGMPFFQEFRNCPFAEEWRDERDAMLYHVGPKLTPAMAAA